MRDLLLAALILVFLGSCSTRYYVVRHAEKAGGASMADQKDPALSAAGQDRAKALALALEHKKIKHIFVTNTIRSAATAAPTAEQYGINPRKYAGTADSSFIGELKALSGHALIIAHSNTIDDIVNKLSGRPFVKTDLPEESFDHLYIIKARGQKKKNRVRLERYGIPSPLPKTYVK